MSSIAIIGGGPAGLTAGIIAKRNNKAINITIYEKNDIGATILPTGGGRCNITHFSDDINSFVKNYPRGENFLYSIFHQFFIDETINFFNSVGIKTYTQDDERIFPVTNKSLDIIFALKNEIKRLNIKVEKQNVTDIKKVNDFFYINGKAFDKCIISTGGRKTELLNSISNLGIDIIPQTPALSALEIQEKEYEQCAGVSLKSILANVKYNNKTITLQDDILFTHNGISGPLAYKVSSLFADKKYEITAPIEIHFDFINDENFNLQQKLDTNSKKEILTIISEFMPKSLAKILLSKSNINFTKPSHQINKDERNIILNLLIDLTIHATKPLEGGTIVSAGGIALNEINSKTMESKKIKNLYFCGEVVDIDGFCGGYNLQNCWSTGYVAGLNASK